jgi:hypothetical protein
MELTHPVRKLVVVCSLSRGLEYASRSICEYAATLALRSTIPAIELVQKIAMVLEGLVFLMYDSTSRPTIMFALGDNLRPEFCQYHLGWQRKQLQQRKKKVQSS